MLLRSGVCALPAARHWAHDLHIQYGRRKSSTASSLPLSRQSKSIPRRPTHRTSGLFPWMRWKMPLLDIVCTAAILSPTSGPLSASPCHQLMADEPLWGVLCKASDPKGPSARQAGLATKCCKPQGPSEAHRSVRDGRCEVSPDDPLPTQMLVRRSLRSRAEAYAVPRARRSQAARGGSLLVFYTTRGSVGKLPVMAVAGYTVVTHPRHIMFASDGLGGRAVQPGVVIVQILTCRASHRLQVGSVHLGIACAVKDDKNPAFTRRIREIRSRIGAPWAFWRVGGIVSHWCMSAVGDGRRGRVIFGLGDVRSSQTGVLGAVVR
ncbi:hypothetical protein C8T65DRAFT_1102 [Cerioporus squamosus]|nr:hypothetical protein C8T65DRAFT_1102 [Cerioporus squamosus]